jgi:4-amino-4-deoxy-L-arabinose transferase-like glycosyltransferase
MSAEKVIRWILLMLSTAGVVFILVGTSAYGPGLTSDSITYIATGRNVASGHGFVSYDDTPYYQWPPLMPLTAAVCDLAGLPPARSLCIVNALLFGLAIYLTGRILARRLHTKTLALVGAAAVMVSPPLARFAMYVLSDFPLAVLALAFLYLVDRYERHPKATQLVAIAIVSSLACLTRYIGGALALTGIVWLIFDRQESANRRLKQTISYALISGIPLAIWLARNMQVIGSPFGIRPFSQVTLTESFLAAVRTIASWLIPLPVGVSLQVVGLLSVSALLVIGYVWAIKRHRRLHMPTVVRLSALFAGIYCLALVITAAVTTIDLPDARLLSPIYIPLLLVGLYLLDAIIVNLPHRWASRLPMAIIVILIVGLGISAYLTAPKLSDAMRNGFGMFSHRGWHESRLLQYLRSTMPPGGIYSNGPEAIYYYAGLTAMDGPQKYHYNSPGGGGDNLEAFKQRVASVPIALVWFDILRRPHLYAPSELAQQFQVDTVAQFEDGVIFRLQSIKR